MRKLLLVIPAMVLLLALSASAQEDQVGKMSFGVKAGLTISTLRGDSLANLLKDLAQAQDLPGKKSRTGAGFGAFARYSVAPSVALQVELVYIQKGCKYDFAGGGTSTARSAWLEVPILMEITPELRRSKIAPAVFAGPFIGLNTSAQFQQSGFAEDVKVPGDFNAADSVKSTDFGVTFGGGLGYKLTTESEIFFDIRYDFGLTKILKSGVLNHPDAQADTKTSALLVTAGYRFGL